jgi:PiT family inorganic phosphate transporter
MDSITIFIFLSSGLFLGWSLGANDAANVFGSAVGSRMVRFSTAAFLCSVFIILGAVIGGAGAARGLGELGAVNAIAGSFTVALAAALTVFGMTKIGIPVSTSQAVVGAIIGWNWFSNSLTDLHALMRIMATWIASPILGGIFAALLYKLLVALIYKIKPHLLELDFYTRTGLIIAGIFGSYALGANNISNVMGVFVEASPFTDFKVGNLLTFTSVEQLFLLGGIAIAVGVYTYSKPVMMTVGTSLMPLTPLAAFVVVVAHSLVLFLFSSTDLQNLFIHVGLPPIPLIPVSSSQAVIGGIIGIGLIKGVKTARQIKWKVIGGIVLGWIATPIIGSIIGFFLLFIVQNVFNQQVYEEVNFILSQPVLAQIKTAGISIDNLTDLKDQQVTGAVNFRNKLLQVDSFDESEERLIISTAEVYDLTITLEKINAIRGGYLTTGQLQTLRDFNGRSFNYKWQLRDALAQKNDEWKFKENTPINHVYNKTLDEQLNYVYRIFHDPELRETI